MGSCAKALIVNVAIAAVRPANFVDVMSEVPRKKRCGLLYSFSAKNMQFLSTKQRQSSAVCKWTDDQFWILLDQDAQPVPAGVEYQPPCLGFGVVAADLDDVGACRNPQRD